MKRDLALSMKRDLGHRNGTPEPDDTGPDLTPAQLQVVAALAGGASLTEAAERANVGRRTVYMWRHSDPAFIAELNAAKAEARERVRAEVRSLASEAVETIRSVMTSAETPPALRLKAALSVLQAVGAEPVGPTDPEAIRERQEEDEYLAEHPFEALIGRMGSRSRRGR